MSFHRVVFIGLISFSGAFVKCEKINQSISSRENLPLPLIGIYIEYSSFFFAVSLSRWSNESVSSFHSAFNCGIYRSGSSQIFCKQLRCSLLLFWFLFCITQIKFLPEFIGYSIWIFFIAIAAASKILFYLFRLLFAELIFFRLDLGDLRALSIPRHSQIPTGEFYSYHWMLKWYDLQYFSKLLSL